MLGLNISSGFKSVITIYILIPFILIPQLLFSGALVKFDKLHTSKTHSSGYVPLIGEIMPARWSFEALAVEQFQNNEYERNFFKRHLEISQNDWYANYLIPALKSDLSECQDYVDSIPFRDVVSDNFYKLSYYSEKLSGIAGFNSIPIDMKNNLTIEKFNSEVAKETNKYLDSLQAQFRFIRKKNIDLKDSIEGSILASIGEENLVRLKSNYYNRSLEDLVLDRYSTINKTFETDKKIIQKFEPAFMKPVSKIGRAQFYAPYKLIGNMMIDTLWFNVIVLWLIALGLYIALYFNLPQKTGSFFKNLKFT